MVISCPQLQTPGIIIVEVFIKDQMTRPGLKASEISNCRDTQRRAISRLPTSEKLGNRTEIRIYNCNRATDGDTATVAVRDVNGEAWPGS